MSYLGKWVFHSIGVMDENDNYVYLSAEEYLSSPMPYIDETDEEAVADELKERNLMIGTQLKICEDGKMYILMPIPAGATQEEIDAAVSSGAIKLMDGMLMDKPRCWEERDGDFWYNSEIEGEVCGETADPWLKASDENGFINMFTTRFTKAD